MGHGLINQPELYESSPFNESEKERLRVTEKALVFGKDYDRLDVTYPTTTQEIYTYTLSAVNVLVIEVNYTNASKEDLTSVVQL